jgi:hypothetical protein
MIIISNRFRQIDLPPYPKLAAANCSFISSSSFSDLLNAPALVLALLVGLQSTAMVQTAAFVV